MRRAFALVLGLALVVVAALGAAQVVRARLETSPQLRKGVARVASAQLGVELEVGALGVDLWPVGLRLVDAEVALPGGAQLELAATALQVEPGLLLLQGVPRVRAVSIDGPARLVAGALTLPGEIALELRPGESGEWSGEGRATLETGGTLIGSGRLDASGALRGELRLEGVEAAPFAVLIQDEDEAPAELAGLFDGELEPPRDGRPASLQLTSPAARIDVDPVRLDGPVALFVQLPRPASEPPARFAIDASKARVEYAGGPARATGDGASVQGRIVRRPEGGLRVEEIALKVNRFRGEMTR